VQLLHRIFSNQAKKCCPSAIRPANRGEVDLMP
jgi:hypothetical protein